MAQEPFESSGNALIVDVFGTPHLEQSLRLSVLRKDIGESIFQDLLHTGCELSLYGHLSFFLQKGASDAPGYALLTALVFLQLLIFLQMYFVRVHFSIKAIILFQYASEPAGPGIHGTPISHTFDFVNFSKDIVKLSFSERLYWYALL